MHGSELIEPTALSLSISCDCMIMIDWDCGIDHVQVREEDDTKVTLNRQFVVSLIFPAGTCII